MSAKITSPGKHPADSHDRIRVQGARQNNLKDISIEIPKRRLTLTGRHLSDRASLKPSVRKPTGVLKVRGAPKNNLKNVDVDISLGAMVARRIRRQPGRPGGGEVDADQ